MAVSSTQVQFDSLFGLFTYLAFAVGIVVFTFMIYLIVRYREKASSRQPKNILPSPMGQNIRLNVTSADVFHDFGIIGYDIKTDAIPGRTNIIWFYPDSPGNFTIQCFELCGAGHAFMKGTLMVMTYSSYM